MLSVLIAIAFDSYQLSECTPRAQFLQVQNLLENSLIISSKAFDNVADK